MGIPLLWKQLGSISMFLDSASSLAHSHRPAPAAATAFLARRRQASHDCERHQTRCCPDQRLPGVSLRRPDCNFHAVRGPTPRGT